MQPPPSFAAKVADFGRRYAYVALAGGALLVLVQTVEFRPPDRVRLDPNATVELVGDAPAQEFSARSSNAQVVQLRATLRRYTEPGVPAGAPDPEVDDRATILSQPVVSTILGMNATFEQTVRLENGDLEVDLAVHATPRLEGKGKHQSVSLEHQVEVISRRRSWWGRRTERRVHLDIRGVLTGVEDRGHRIVFTVDRHLFALDLEMQRSF